jgi:hypothetical protein
MAQGLLWGSTIALGGLALAGVGVTAWRSSYLPALGVIAAHLIAIGIAWGRWTPSITHSAKLRTFMDDALTNAQRRAVRLSRVRQAILIEATVLVGYPIIRTVLVDAPLRWWWPATVAVGATLLCWPIERMALAHARAAAALHARTSAPD